MKQKLKIRLMSMLAVLAAAAGSGLSCASARDGAGDILPSGSLVRNGDFENGLEAFTPHLLPGARGGIAPEGFESASFLTVSVPAALCETENYYAQTVPADPAEPCRSYRLTYWLRY